MDGRDTPNQKVLRLGQEKLAREGLEAHDSNMMNRALDRYPHDQPRPALTNAELVERLQNPAVARFFGGLPIEGIQMDEAA